MTACCSGILDQEMHPQFEKTGLALLAKNSCTFTPISPIFSVHYCFWCHSGPWFPRGMIKVLHYAVPWLQSSSNIFPKVHTFLQNCKNQISCLEAETIVDQLNLWTGKGAITPFFVVLNNFVALYAYSQKCFKLYRPAIKIKIKTHKICFLMKATKIFSDLSSSAIRALYL